ncbi:MAG: transporter associated domain-containing protein [Burkholderiales bacterium]
MMIHRSEGWRHEVANRHLYQPTFAFIYRVLGASVSLWCKQFLIVLRTLSRYIDRQFHRRPVVGDFVTIGGMNLVVREMREGRITKVGIVVRNR